MTDPGNELSACLRAWRERVAPAEVGLPASSRRRVAGLRREEVAGLAGVSVDYLTRLEQGRATGPSVSVLGALARALRLGDAERDHLFRLAGQPLPAPTSIDTHVPARVLRLMDRLTDVPVVISTVAGEIVCANPLAVALFPEARAETRRERTLAWRAFTGMATTRVVDEAEREVEAVALVSDLASALARYPDDGYLRALVDDLTAASPEFARRWAEHRLGGEHLPVKRFVHPEVGELELDCADLALTGTALKLIAFTAAPGSPSAGALALLGTIGLQAFSDA